MRGIVIGLSFFLLQGTSLGDEEYCAKAEPRCEARLELTAGAFSFYRSHSLELKNDRLEQLILVLHGTLRNANDYFESMGKATALAGKADSTLIVAPQIRIDEDPREPGDLFWDESGWKEGAPSLNGETGGVSSFEILDALVERALETGRFANLRRVVITGHSAGGQVVARYMLGTHLPEKQSGVNFRFIVSNPSSYMYLNESRGGAEGGFEIPESECHSYDDYRYGTRNLNAYMEKSGKARLLENVRRRDITLLIGEKDTELELLDVGCEAMHQGANRRERAERFFDHVNHFFSPAAVAFQLVLGVGHDQEKMYQSNEGLSVLFRN